MHIQPGIKLFILGIRVALLCIIENISVRILHMVVRLLMAIAIGAIITSVK